jgi:hypothetical protein
VATFLVVGSAPTGLAVLVGLAVAGLAVAGLAVAGLAVAGLEAAGLVEPWAGAGFACGDFPAAEVDDPLAVAGRSDGTLADPARVDPADPGAAAGAVAPPAGPPLAAGGRAGAVPGDATGAAAGPVAAARAAAARALGSGSNVRTRGVGTPASVPARCSSDLLRARADPGIGLRGSSRSWITGATIRMTSSSLADASGSRRTPYRVMAMPSR